MTETVKHEIPPPPLKTAKAQSKLTLPAAEKRRAMQHARENDLLPPRADS
jgi:hypothetical protein